VEIGMNDFIKETHDAFSNILHDVESNIIDEDASLRILGTVCTFLIFISKHCDPEELKYITKLINSVNEDINDEDAMTIIKSLQGFYKLEKVINKCKDPELYDGL
jgi:hypothetical protein